MLNIYLYFCYFKSTNSKFEVEALLLLMLFSYLLISKILKKQNENPPYNTLDEV